MLVTVIIPDIQNFQCPGVRKTYLSVRFLLLGALNHICVFIEGLFKEFFSCMLSNDGSAAHNFIDNGFLWHHPHPTPTQTHTSIHWSELQNVVKASKITSNLTLTQLLLHLLPILRVRGKCLLATVIPTTHLKVKHLVEVPMSSFNLMLFFLGLGLWYTHFKVVIGFHSFLSGVKMKQPWLLSVCLVWVKTGLTAHWFYWTQGQPTNKCLAHYIKCSLTAK